MEFCWWNWLCQTLYAAAFALCANRLVKLNGTFLSLWLVKLTRRHLLPKERAFLSFYSSRRLSKPIVCERLDRSQAKELSKKVFLQNKIKMKFFSVLCVFCFLPRPGMFFSITVRTTSGVDLNVSTKHTLCIRDLIRLFLVESIKMIIFGWIRTTFEVIFFFGAVW